MTEPTRFPNGVTTAAKGDALGDSLYPDPSLMHVFFDDFNFFDSNQWTKPPGGATNGTLLVISEFRTIWSSTHTVKALPS